MYTVGFHTLGCKVNQYETEGIMSQFEDKGYKVVDFHDFAQIYIINTCIVTNIAEKKSRQMISKARTQNPDAIIVVIGCYAQNAKDNLEESLGVNIVIGNTKKNEVLQLVEDYLITRHKLNLVESINNCNSFEEISHLSAHDKTRAYIKIQDGCNQFCSYCIIPYVRGRVRSRNRESILKEVKTVVNNGYQEIVVTGIHMASYGVDIEGYSFIQLLEDLQKIEGLHRIRIGSLDPKIVTEAFVNRLTQLSKVCPHFHLSLQSGCDDTLRRMNRGYTTKDYYNSVVSLRKGYNNPAITTDVIVGFPGETEQEFSETVDFLKKIAFMDIHVFKYSIREGTKAANMPDQVTSEKKKERSSQLIALKQQLHKNYLKQFINQEIEVLFEEIIVKNGKEYYNGYTDNYIKVIVPHSNYYFSNQLVTLKTIKIEDDYLLGNITNE
jgi:threonylcarbamoyladenosine tRNA methylthiotransferase MtaB